MKKLLFLGIALLVAGAAFAQPTVVPPCNSFDVNGVPIYSVLGYGDTTAATPTCTDYFGVANWATSPLPAGTITGYTLVAGGSGYVNPDVVVTDVTGVTFDFLLSASDVVGGVVSSITGGTGGQFYTMPKVTIVDVGLNGTLAAPTCGGLAQPACGSGAMATAVIGGPFAAGTGMLKFQDALVDLRTVIATPDTTTFPGADYYEIALVQFSQKMHSSLPPTTVRGYVQVPTGSSGCGAALAATPTYMGPTIVATKDRAVRIKFTNCLPTGSGGNLFIPTDTTYMGAGKGPDGSAYTENRAVVHLHGGATPWISDGTPHQWTVPFGEGGTLQRGASAQNVPDMYFVGGVVVPQCSATVTTNCSDPSKANLPAGAVPDPGQGSLTYYWTNQQGGRLMFYHDHAYGITRLNVYAGVAAGYLIVDPAEENALAAATAPGTLGTSPDLAHLIPLVIQDKTFVPSAAQVAEQDPTWVGNFGATPLSATGSNGDLWFPHVYIPNQNPADTVGGANGYGHWDYGAWFFPPQTTLTAANPTTAVTVPCTSAAFPGQDLAPTPACPTCGCPIIPNVSGTPEGFMDTPIVNGVAYPVLHVAPAAYRFRILSVGNDRSLNLSWFVADPTQLVNGIPTEVAMLPAVPPSTGTPLPLCTAINPVAVPQLGLGMAAALLDNSGNPLNGTGLPANCWPNYGPLSGIPPAQTMWAADGRVGGAPDPRLAGPPWIQIGSEGGLLPAPAVIPATPVNYEQNTRSITITNVAVHGLWLGPAERADVIVDFSQFAGKTLIMYNDAPAPAPAIDSRLDYFTGDGDQTPIGGAPNTQPGYGPNTRTIMQVVVDQAAPNTVPFSLPTLKAAFASTATTTGLFASTQPTTIVPEPAYNSAYNQTFPSSYMGISANNLAFTPIAYPQTFDNGQAPCLLGQCNPLLDQKTIQELFTLDYGRMNATFGTELPLTNFQTQTTVPLGYVDWPTELIQSGQTQLWKITHNGVDTHFIHFHLFNVQVVNRVGWDGSLRQVDPNEAGWKETVRMNPLEDVLVALQPITPTFPFPLPDSIRAADVTMPAGQISPALSGLDPTTGNAGLSTTNALVNYGWEYVWHCHILGHEENDMMRAIIYQVAPPAPTNLLAAAPTPTVLGAMLTWMDNSSSETSFTVQRDTVPGFNSANLTSFTVDGASLNTTGFSTPAWAATVTYLDTTAVSGATYFYRVQANDSFTPTNQNPVPFQQSPLSSAWSNIATVNSVPLTPTVTFTGAPATALYGASFVVTATTNSSSVPAITGTAGVCSVGAVTGNAASASATVTMLSGSGVCTLTANWAADNFFNPATATQTTNAQPAPLTITANNKSKVYGTAVTFLGTEFTVTGLVGTDTVSSVTLTSAGAAANAAVGSYPIIPSAAVGTNLANYMITYVNGTLTVTAAPLTITANNASKAYGQALTFAGTEFTATGLVSPDTVSSVTLTSTGAPATAAVGTYPIVPSAAVGTGLANYTITYVNGTLTVTGNPLTITANSASKIYGQTLTFAGTEFTAIGLVNGNTVTSVTLTCAGAVAAAAPGSYPIVPSAAVGTGLANYTITYVNGTLTVSKAASVTTITSSLPNPSIRGQIVTVSFTVAPQFTGVASGTVSVVASTGETCSAALAAGAGSCTLTFLSGGSRTLTANYPGDTNFLASASAPVTEVVSSVVLSTNALLFGNQLLNTTSASQTVTLSNVGTANVAINSITISGNFTQSNNCPIGGSLRAGRSCSITVRFTPRALGVLTGTLTISDADVTSPQLVSLTGTGVQPVASLSPTSLSFSILRRGSQTLPVTLSNTGTAPMTITGISISGSNHFSQSNNCGGSLAIGASCTINVTFSTNQAQTVTGTLNVSDNAPGSPQTVALTGTAQ
jgi:FtsP/CotA-like multicopper oxidase with cupredoxin domain